MFRFHPSYYKFITIKFCAWHNNFAVMACTKFCNDLISNWINVKMSLPSNLNFEWKIHSETSSRTHHLCHRKVIYKKEQHYIYVTSSYWLWPWLTSYVRQRYKRQALETTLHKIWYLWHQLFLGWDSFTKHYFWLAFYIIPPNWDDTRSCNPSSWKAETYLC